MAYPVGVITRICTVGGSAAVESGTDLVLSVSIEASRGLIRDGERMPSSPEVKTSIAGGEVSFDLPVSDQSGYRDEATGAVIDVSAPDSHTHTYTATITTTRGTKFVNQRVVNFPLPGDDLSPVDVDTLIAAGSVDGVLVSVPDSLTPRMAALEDAVGALEAGGVGSVVGVTADDTPAAPAEGESASYLVTSAVTWPAGLVWSTDPDGGVAPTITGTALVSMFTLGGITRAIMGATFPAPPAPADTTAPSIPAGLSATAASSATVDLAWSASTDDSAVTGYEYRVGGGTAVDAGAGLTETVTGLTASTLYSFEVRAYDAAGNRSGWSTAASATTSAPPADSTPPTVGTMAASSITASGFTLTVSGASDETALHAAPYAFTTNGGADWTAYQASPVLVVTGKTAATGYSCNWRVRDAAGNVSTGTAQTVTTGSGAPVADWAAYDAAVTAATPFYNVKLSTNSANTGSSAATFTPTDITFGTEIGGTTGASFNGTTSKLVGSAGSNPVGWNTTALTIEAVVKPSTANRGDIAGGGVTSQLLSLDNGRPVGYLNAATNFARAATALAIGTANHIAMTYDGVAIRTYVNGVEAATFPYTAAISGSGVWNIGLAGLGSFAGVMTRIAAYTSTLSAGAILDHAQKAGLA